MAQSHHYPASSHPLSPLIDLSSKSERERLSPGAVRAFFNIMARWGVRDEDARALLGGISNGPFYALKKKPDRVLEVDRLTRISYLVGIFKALNVLYSEALADAWMQRPNRNPLFAGQSALHYVLKGGLPALHRLRQLLDARRGAH